MHPVLPYDRHYNTEHEDITFAAIVNEEMINSVYSLAGKYIIPNWQFIVKSIAICAVTLYAANAFIKLKLLTPGSEYIELVCIVVSLTTMVAVGYLATNLLKEMDAHLTRLVAERKEMNEYIEELEKENEEMKATFRTMLTHADPTVMQRKRVKRIKN
jgi:hypothetical protein